AVADSDSFGREIVYRLLCTLGYAPDLCRRGFDSAGNDPLRAVVARRVCYREVELAELVLERVAVVMHTAVGELAENATSGVLVVAYHAFFEPVFERRIHRPVDRVRRDVQRFYRRNSL